MIKRVLLVLTCLFLATTLARAEGQGTEAQKQMPENKGIITIDIPESKKNVNLAPGMITPTEKSETIIKVQPTDQKTLSKTAGTDNEQVFPQKPKLNFEGRYYIPPEGSMEWYVETVKNNNEGIKWESFSDDLFIARPGDSWTDLSKSFNFQFSTTISALAFLSFANVDGLKTEARFKSFFLTTALITGLELINSGHPKQHFCAKNLTAGIAGSICGSLVLTVGFGF